jgi:hypothetical protein
LPVGVYPEKVEQDGFKTAVTDNAEITPGATRRTDVSLVVSEAVNMLNLAPIDTPPIDAGSDWM